MNATVYAPTVNLAQELVPQGPRIQIQKALSDLTDLGVPVTEGADVRIIDNDESNFLVSVHSGDWDITLATTNQARMNTVSTEKNGGITVNYNGYGDLTEYDYVFTAGIYRVYESFEDDIRRVLIFIDN